MFEIHQTRPHHWQPLDTEESLGATSAGIFLNIDIYKYYCVFCEFFFTTLLILSEKYAADILQVWLPCYWVTN